MASPIVNRTVNIYIQSGEAQKAFDRLIEKQKKLQEEIAKNPANVEELRKKLAALEEPIDRAGRKLRGELEPSLRDLRTTATSLNNELSRMSESDEGFEERVQQLRQANTELDQQRAKVGLIRQTLNSFWKEAKTVAVGAGLCYRYGHRLCKDCR